ncbi:unnamed protein product [Onchocerca flexuosa]|uniref:Uncharacterized protein n=1 Tax=Onchocerca flexuosa TaxID=387005 RepID=A0A183H1F7_9BILA|nr:unnamed protein product [Onchocerca flexuosa]
MFAPDGSLIKKKNDTKKDAKRIETNQIDDQNESRRDDENLRDIGAADIRAADGPLINGDYDSYPDEKNIRIHEESKVEANFLRRNMHDIKNNGKLQSIDDDDNNVQQKIISSSTSKLFPSNNVERAITTTGAIKPILKSSTATRLQILISDENDTSANKYENFYLASKTEDGKPHRIFPRSNQSPVQVNPSREQIFEDGNIVQLSAWQKTKNRSLHRTTIHPNHFIVRDGEIDRNEVAPLIKSKSASHANFLPKKKSEFALQQHESAEDLINLARKSQPMKLIFDGHHEKVYFI